MHGISALPQSLTGFLSLPDCEMTGSPDQTTSLAPSSQYTAPQSSFPGVKRHMKSTPRSRPYDTGHHSKSKASAVQVQGAADEKLLDWSFARPKGDSLEYAQGLALHPSSWGSRAGGEFGCISAISQCMTLYLYEVHSPLQMPLVNSLQIGGGHSTRATLNPLIGSTTTPAASPAPLPSSAIAAKFAENQLSNPPASVLSVVHRPNNPQQDERNKLAELLHDHLQTNPEPIIGSPDNPFPFADDLGIRGLSILSAFIEHADMETFTCIFCGDIQTDIDVALVHQRTFLKSCVDVRL